MDDGSQVPIYAALVGELDEPDTGDWGISSPPEFATELINSVFSGTESHAHARKTVSKSRKRMRKRAKVH